jgi:hypothetical protein
MFTSYWPSLFYLPILLIAGVFLLVPGGFMIVLGAVYFGAQVFGLFVLGAARVPRQRTRAASPSSVRQATTPRARRSGAVVATPIAAALLADEGVRS